MVYGALGFRVYGSAIVFFEGFGVLGVQGFLLFFLGFSA